jgi:glyoxylase-like metal-dependent hydrolase (beta-lactamase superfamily II)
VCLEVIDEGVLFSGDQLFAGSVGRTDLPGGSWNQLIESMRRRVLDLPDECRVLPGHGPETTIGRERRTNPFLVDLDGGPATSSSRS